MLSGANMLTRSVWPRRKPILQRRRLAVVGSKGPVRSFDRVTSFMTRRTPTSQGWVLRTLRRCSPSVSAGVTECAVAKTFRADPAGPSRNQLPTTRMWWSSIPPSRVGMTAPSPAVTEPLPSLCHVSSFLLLLQRALYRIIYDCLDLFLRHRPTGRAFTRSPFEIPGHVMADGFRWPVGGRISTVVSGENGADTVVGVLRSPMAGSGGRVDGSSGSQIAQAKSV